MQIINNIYIGKITLLSYNIKIVLNDQHETFVDMFQMRSGI